MAKTTLIPPGLALAAALVLGGCAQNTGVFQSTDNGETGKAGQSQYTLFPDVPLPQDAKMNVDKTLAFGGGDTWIGQLALVTGHAHNEMFNFFKKQLPEFGWQEITSVRAPTSVLTYQRANRVLAIQVQGASLNGSEVTMTVSPREQASANAAPGQVGAGIIPAPVRRTVIQ